MATRKQSGIQSSTRGENSSFINRSDIGVKGPMSRRTPSILVTDSRNILNRRSAPFAGMGANGGMGSVRGRPGSNFASPNYRSMGGKPQGYSSESGSPHSSFQNGKNSNNSGQQTPSRNSRRSTGIAQNGMDRTANGNRRGSVNSMDKSSYSGLNQISHRRKSSNYSNITMDRILSDVSDVPSGRPEERMVTPTHQGFTSMRNHYSYSKFRNLRTSKTSEKLVLIPDSAETDQGFVGKPLSSNFKQSSFVEGGFRDPSDYSRITAFNVSEGLNLKLLSKCLRKTHGISTRLYDECLYALYCLPLLSGENGFRVKSSVPRTTKTGETVVDKYIDKNEQIDHHYEYFSGIETVEHRNNSFDIKVTPGEESSNSGTSNNSSAANNEEFDPSEPQFFAETNADTNLPKSADLHPSASNHSSDSESSTTNNVEQHGEMFIFNYGIIVFWNFTEEQEKNILADIQFSPYYENIVIYPSGEQQIESEEYSFEYDKEIDRPRILNDIVTLKSGDHIIKLTLSHAMAQSCKLSKFETRLVPILATVTKLPKRLALYGKLGMTRQKLLKKFGKLFKLRVDVNLSSNILDTPDFFWSLEPSLDPLYSAMREYLEIDERVQVLNEKCRVFLEFVDICVDSIAEKNMTRITRWIIIVFFISVIVSILEIFIRYLIIQRNNALSHV